MEISRDAGSIPAASTKPLATLFRKWFSFWALAPTNGSAEWGPAQFWVAFADIRSFFLGTFDYKLLCGLRLRRNEK